jgi:hypothetical protein
VSARCTIAVGALAAALGAGTPAHADRWHAGVNLRADSGAHPFRLTGGYTTGTLDAALVLDPMFVFDGQHDLDALVTIWPERFGLLTGWRTSLIGVAGGTQAQHKLLLGVSAPLPSLGPVRPRWSFELATVIVRHGADLPTDWLSLAEGRDFVDLINFGMFVSFEYGRDL